MLEYQWLINAFLVIMNSNFCAIWTHYLPVTNCEIFTIKRYTLVIKPKGIKKIMNLSTFQLDEFFTQYDNDNSKVLKI